MLCAISTICTLLVLVFYYALQPPLMLCHLEVNSKIIINLRLFIIHPSDYDDAGDVDLELAADDSII